MVSNPIYVIAFLCFNIVLCELLCQRTRLKYLGTSLLVIVITAIVANFGLIPTSSNAILLGVLISTYIVGGSEGLGNQHHILAGMMTGTYVGGSVNFNAVALHYGMTKNGALYAGTAAVDSIFTTLWMVASIILPKYLNKVFPREAHTSQVKIDNKNLEKQSEQESLNPIDLGILLTLAFGSFWLSKFTAAYLSNFDIQIPSIIILTTIALVLAQTKFVQNISGARLLGIFLVYLFLAVIGAYCEIGALYSIGNLAWTLIMFIGVIVFIHGLFTFGVGALFKQDWGLIAVASQANIGGGSTALALAKSIKRNDLLFSINLI